MRATEKDSSERGKPSNPVWGGQVSDAATDPDIGVAASACKTKSAGMISNENKVPASLVLAGKMRICLLCSEPSDEMFCGACVDKIRADAVEHKRWEETGKP
jgi:hypothetical protein